MPNDPDTDTTNPFPTPWAAEGRWPTAGEMQDWLHQHHSTRHALTLLGQYIDMAQAGANCIDSHHAERLAELQVPVDVMPAGLLVDGS